MTYFNGTPETDTLIGTADRDNMAGRHGDDLLVGGGGNDTIYGMGENDRIYGQDGDDLLFGGNGEDELFGGYGANTLLGGDYNDAIYVGPDPGCKAYGGAGDDGITVHGESVVYGGSGNDRLAAVNSLEHEASHDLLVGGNGDDWIYTNDSTTWGQDGNDHFFLGGIGQDISYGGNGADTFVAHPEYASTLVGGEGQDTFLIYYEPGVTLSGGAGAAGEDVGLVHIADFTEGEDTISWYFG